MERIEKTMEVDRPVRTVYNQWTQFEEFPRFMDGVKELQQLDDTRALAAEAAALMLSWGGPGRDARVLVGATKRRRRTRHLDPRIR